MDKEEMNINVHVRIRPLNRNEIASGAQSAIEKYDNSGIFAQKHNKMYSFDMVYDETATQEEVYKNSVEYLIDEVLQGYNVTVFAYGQTGTGKTYTMGGGSMCHGTYDAEDPHAGIIPRAVIDLFHELENRKGWSLKVTFLELYNEVLTDLLDDKSQEIRIMEKDGNNILFPPPEKQVHSMKELFRLLEIGTNKRATSATKLNEESSRSHSVFTLQVCLHGENLDEEFVVDGKVNFVDLAGSENIGKSGAINKRACEAGKINQSLLAIGRVINALVDKSPHIPYRESKLTRILQDSLGGNTKTTLIATVSQSHLDIEESFKTLDYAQRAKKIKNQPEQSKILTKKYEVSNLSNDIEKLKRDLDAQRSKVGVHLSHERYSELIGEYNTFKHELSEKERIAGILEEKLKELMEDKSKKQQDLETCEHNLDELKKKISRNNMELENYKTKCEDNNVILTYCDYRYKKLQNEATALLDVVKQSTKNEEILIDKVNKLYEKSHRNSTLVSQSCDFITKMKLKTANTLKSTYNITSTIKNELIDSLGKKQSALSHISSSEEKLISNAQQNVQNITTLITNSFETYNQEVNNTREQINIDCEKMLENFREQLNAGLENVAMSLLKYEDNLENFSMDCKEQTEHMLETVDTLRETTSYIEKNLFNKEQEFREQISSLSLNLQQSIERELGIYQEQIMLSKRHHEFIENKIQQIKPELDNMKFETQNYTAKKIENCKISSALSKDIHTQILDIREKSVKSLGDIKNKWESEFLELENSVENVKKVATDIKEKWEEKNKLCNLDQENIKDKVQTLLLIDNSQIADGIHENIDKIHSCSVNFANDCKAKFTGDNMIQINAAIKSALKMCLNYPDILTEENKNYLAKLQEAEQEIQSMKYKSSNCLYQMKDRLNSFISNEFDPVQHQGDTPKREEYNIPRKLTKVKTDFNLVVKEYRKALSENGHVDGNIKEAYMKDIKLFDKFDETEKENQENL